MVSYRRNFLEGGSYFFTVNLRDRRSKLLVEEVNLLRQSIKAVQGKYPFQIDAIVVLPEHLHAIWTLPEFDADYSARWRRIKGYFTRELSKPGSLLEKNDRHEYCVWQPRFWEHTIRDEHDFEGHVNYIHYNPVKHGLVKQVCDWPYSSFHQYVKRGLLTKDWGAQAPVEMGMSHGE